MRASDTTAPQVKAESQFLLAMTHCRLQDIDSARAALSSGIEVVKAEHPNPLDYGKEAEHWVAAELLRREAERLLDGVDPKSVDPPK